MVSLVHKFVSSQSDGPDDTVVRPSDWNNEHDLILSTTGVVIGRKSAGSGAAEELSSADLVALLGSDVLLPSDIGSSVQAYNSDLTSWAGITRASGFDTFVATPSSANLASLLTDKTGSEAAVFASAPTLSNPIVGTQANGDNSTKAASTAYVLATRIDQIAAPTSDVGWNSKKITGLADPSSTQDAATKNYVDTVAQGLDAKASARVATTANGTLSTAFANGQTVDGVTLATGDRILIKNQTTQTENGIYTVNSSGAPTRANDFDAWTKIPGAFCFVEEGTTNANTGWTCTSDAGGTIGSTNIVFTQFSGAGTYTNGTGLSLTGTQFSIDTSVTVDKTTAQTLTNKTLTAPAISSPTGIVKGDVGLGNVDNTSDATKNSATATLTNKTFDTAGTGNVFKINGTAISDKTGTGKAVLDTSPTLSSPVVGTQSSRDNSTKAASTEYADNQVDWGTLINTQTASYTAVFTDAGKTIEMNVGSANNFTVPANASVAFPVGTYLNVSQIGAGLTTIVAGSGVTINSRNGLKMGGQYAMATLYKRATDTWQLGGDVSS